MSPGEHDRLAPQTSRVTIRRCRATRTPQLRAGMVVGALGVVFGDIGTSPIYTVQTLFNRGTRTRFR